MDGGVYRIAASTIPLTHKIPSGDPMWSTFNASFENRRFAPWDLAEAVYTGHAITTWHRDHWRSTPNYVCGQHLGLDFDSENETCTLGALASEKFIAHYAAMIHTSISHRPEAPRARVIFLLDEPILQAANYTLAAAALLWLFGTADRACKDAVRFWYGAPGCEFSMLDNVLPLDVIRRLIAQYQESGLRERKRQAAFTPTTDQEEVAAALKLINPWQIDYQEWLQVLMAIHATFGQGGLGMAASWAAGKDGEVERKWASFKRDGDGGVTIATVFGIAKRFGWSRRLN